MRLNRQIKYYFYRSLSIVVAIAIVANSWGIERSIALTPQPVSAQPNPIAIGDNICSGHLKSVLDPIVTAPTFAKGKWGVLVESLGTGQILYQHHPDRSLIPASNVKLLTTAAAVKNLPQLPPSNLTEWLRSIGSANRDSNNRQADRLLSKVGGVQAVQTAISPLGVNPSTYKQVDGSGLSRSNRAAPLAFVNLLRGIAQTPSRQIFHDSLSIAGVNGTLRNRLQAPQVRGRVYAKTGTLKGVRTLSGYLDNPNYGGIVFSIMVNQSGLSGKVMTQAIDEMVVDLARVKDCRAIN